MTGYIDLHTHSYCSDGTFSPEGLVILAKQKGLSAIALTDHDTIDGLSLFLEAGQKHGLETIAGIEFAAQYEKFHQPEIHIVGLGFVPDHKALVDNMAQIKQDRHTRNEEMCQKLTAIGLPISMEEVTKCAGGEIVTRAHFAKILLQKHLVSSREEVFSRYLSPGCPAYVPRKVLTPAQCIQTIHAAGGIAILAHPTLYHLELEQIHTLCQELKSLGLDGMECYYSTYNAQQTKDMMHISKQLDLLPSGGSDFHGENKPQIQLGSGKNNLAIPYEIWENLRALLP